MKKYKNALLILLTSISLLLGCNQTDESANLEDDIKKIKEVAAQYRNAGTSGDLDLFMDAWTDDAIRMEDGFHAIIGKEKIREHFEPLLGRFDNKIELYGNFEIEVSGTLAYSISNYIITITPKDGGPVTKFDGKVVDVYKKQADGSWKIYIDAPSSNPKWTNESVSPEMMEKQDSLDPLL